MAKAIPIRLRPDQRGSPEHKRKTHPDPRVRRRAGIVLMSDDGWAVADICTAAGVTRATVANTRRRWVQGDVGALSDAPRPGRPAIADGEYLAALLDAVNTGPSSLGYAFGLWTTGRLTAHLHRHHGNRLSAECVGDHPSRPAVPALASVGGPDVPRGESATALRALPGPRATRGHSGTNPRGVGVGRRTRRGRRQSRRTSSRASSYRPQRFVTPWNVGGSAVRTSRSPW